MLYLTEGVGHTRVRAPQADSVELCLLGDEGGESRVQLERGADGYHTAQVPGVVPGQRYGFRARGPWKPEAGLWHDPRLLLIDPEARAVSGRFRDHPTLHHEGPRRDTTPHVPRSVVVEPPPPPRPGPGIPWSDTVIYETHVRGLTMAHPGVSPGLRGTYLGACSEPVVEHLHRLGVTTVELMPVAHHVTEPFLQGRGAKNYWGYSTLAWFAPHAGYATADDGRQVAEFAAMVDRFHAAGLEVIVDVVFNHTAEGGLEGPILSMKGLDNPGWYRLEGDGDYVDWTGTGNTVDAANPAVREAVLDSLRWWANGLGVDGFRFDLAVTLGRDGEGFDPAHLDWITSDPELAGCKLIAEPWDLGPHGYRVGGFGDGWAEWNGGFRDEIRDLWRGLGDAGAVGRRLGGSPDLFSWRSPHASINFVTAHDGFTLADLVSYDHKHNEANGEHNEDGHDDNRSWNSGVEGPTVDPGVLETRRRRSAALIVTTLTAAGVPMLLGGDELGRSQGGNNNAYAVDDSTTWYDWSDTPHADLIARAVEVRRRHPMLGGSEFPTVTTREQGDAIVCELTDTSGRVLIVTNPASEPTEVPLPGGEWLLELDSSDLAHVGRRVGSLTVGPWTAALLTPA